MAHYRLSIKGKVSGPHSLEALKEMASIGAFDRTALLAPDGTDQWKSVGESGDLATQLFPERPKMQLKAKAIVATPDSDQPVSVDQILAGNVAADNRRAEPLIVKRRMIRRRTTDFLLAVAALDLVAAAGWYFLPHNAVVIVALLSYVAISNLGVYWVYFHIIDRY